MDICPMKQGQSSPCKEEIGQGNVRFGFFELTIDIDTDSACIS
jgi:hypothetical protein